MARLTVCPVFWSVARMPDAAPLSSGGTAFMIEAVFGAANIPPPSPMTKMIIPNCQIAEVVRKERKGEKGAGGDHHSERGKQPGSMLVREDSAQRTHYHEPENHRDHVDPRPERRGLVADPVQREPYPLEEDDEHYLHPASPYRGQQAGEVCGGEHPVLEQIEAEHRVSHSALYERENYEQGEPCSQRSDDPRIAPAHRRASGRNQSVGHPYEQQSQASPEGGVAPDVELLILSYGADLP